MTIAPIIEASLSADELRKRLKTALDLIAIIATEAGEVPAKELFGNKSLRNIIRHFDDIDTVLANLAGDDIIPF